jgi:hypothetical protein
MCQTPTKPRPRTARWLTVDARGLIRTVGASLQLTTAWKNGHVNERVYYVTPIRDAYDRVSGYELFYRDEEGRNVAYVVDTSFGPEPATCWECSCPAFRYGKPCRHVLGLAAALKALGVEHR